MQEVPVLRTEIKKKTPHLWKKQRNMSTKQELMKSLTEAGIDFSAQETIPEMKYKLQLHRETSKSEDGKGSRKLKNDPMTGMSHLRKATLQLTALKLGTPVKDNQGGTW